MEQPEIRRLFGQRIRALRRRRDLTQEALADAIGRSVDTISNIETGRLTTRIDTATKLAAAFGITLAELFDIGETIGSVDLERQQAIAGLIRTVEPVDANTVVAITKIVERILSLNVGRPSTEAVN